MAVLEVLVLRKVAAQTRGYSLTKLVRVESEYFLTLPEFQLAMVAVAQAIQIQQMAFTVQQLVVGLAVLRH